MVLGWSWVNSILCLVFFKTKKNFLRSIGIDRVASDQDNGWLGIWTIPCIAYNIRHQIWAIGFQLGSSSSLKIRIPLMNDMDIFLVSEKRSLTMLLWVYCRLPVGLLTIRLLFVYIDTRRSKTHRDVSTTGWTRTTEWKKKRKTTPLNHEYNLIW